MIILFLKDSTKTHSMKTNLNRKLLNNSKIETVKSGYWEFRFSLNIFSLAAWLSDGMMTMKNDISFHGFLIA